MDALELQTSDKLNAEDEHANGPSQILAYLYLGCAEDADKFEKLTTQLNISTMVQLGCKGHLPDRNDLFTYHYISIIDSPFQNIRQHFENCFSWIDEAKAQGKSTLVHCRQGRSRSAAIVIAYLMKTQQWTLKYAYDYVLTKRSHVWTKFIVALRDYEIELFGKASVEVKIIGEEAQQEFEREQKELEERRKLKQLQEQQQKSASTFCIVS